MCIRDSYEGSLTEAVKRLEASVKVYRDLAHPSLIRLVEAKEIGGGFLAVFDWTNGECLGRMYPLSRQKFLAMPEEIKLQVYRDILVFHEHVIQKGYVAVDFYDSSILYDFNQKKTMLCDIAVSYTHLDVYKRQLPARGSREHAVPPPRPAPPSTWAQACLLYPS